MLSDVQKARLLENDSDEWALLDWRCCVYLWLTSSYSEFAQIWARQITERSVVLRRPDQYGRSSMVNNFCRGYVRILDDMLKRAMPHLNLQARVSNGSLGSYLEVVPRSPLPQVTWGDLVDLYGHDPAPWGDILENWKDWSLDIREQFALSHVMRMTLGSDGMAASPGGEGVESQTSVSRNGESVPVTILSSDSLSATVSFAPGADGAVEPGAAPAPVESLNAAALAREVGISVRNMQRYMSGERGIPVEVLSLVLQARPDIDPRHLIDQLAEKNAGKDELN